MDYIIKKRYQQLFIEEIDQTFDYIQDLNLENFEAIVCICFFVNIC